MNDQEFKALQATFPWTEQRMQTTGGLLIRMLDKNGAEVPLLAMTAFLAMITTKLSAKEQTPS